MEGINVTGDGGAELQYRVDAGTWYDYTFHIQGLSPGAHVVYTRKKYDTNCQASLSVNICSGGGGGGGGGGTSCPPAGCLSIGAIGYNCGSGILETVNVSGGSGDYQYSLDNCTNWKDYAFQIQQIPNGSHTMYVRDKLNINCGDVATFTVSCNSLRQGTKEEATVNPEEAKNELAIFPNPATDEVVVSYYLEKDEQAEIVLVDIVGKVLQKREVLGKGQTHKEKFIIKSLSAGTYYINLRTKTLSTSKRLIKD
jgi:hypothetical protein